MIEEVIETGFEIPAKRERIGKAKIYEFNQERHGKFYEQKRVELFYVIEEKRFMYSMEGGRYKMHVFYNDKTDLLYIRFDNRNLQGLDNTKAKTRICNLHQY